MSDLGLTVPLSGIQLIEASAGTGKTYTLATLYVRLIVEARLTVPEVLAVTFTVAATAELRTRLRERLTLALALADGGAAPDGSEPTVALVDAALRSETRAALVHRLRAAVESMDLAPIHTIHAFCQRALADHALEAAQPLAARELVTNENALRLEVATEFWRRVSYDDGDADVLLEHWTSPQRLADDLRDWLGHDAIEPHIPAQTPTAAAALDAATQALRAAVPAHADSARAALQQAFDGGTMQKQKFAVRHVQARWEHLLTWRDAPATVPPPRDKLDWFTPEGLRERAKDGQHARVPQSPLFDAIAAWMAADDALTLERARRRIALVHRACAFARGRLAELKAQRGQQGFDDLVRDTEAALHGPNGMLFARRLRAQYRVALVDEFQDTDPRQWSIFRHVFAAQPDPDDPRPHALFLIGDPKQSIYRFRGGDVFTYLAAARQASQTHSLAHNFRSRPSLLRAVEALFAMGGEDAFAQDGIAFVPVAPGGRCADDALRIDGAVAPALTVLTLASMPKQPIDETRDAAAIACAAQIQALLRDARAGRVQRGSGNDTRAVRPGDIAVLVRSNRDALRMQHTLAAIGVPSVAPARDSVFASEEAEEWRRLLLAIVAPGDDGRLRAALATPLLGWSAADIAALDDDALQQRGAQDLAQAWRHQLDRHGLLALGNTLCAEQAPRLLALADGERRLTNHLQLLDALQCDPAAALGARALLDALERRMRDADADNEDEQLRLESDADRVTILTLHRSKGLEFDLVFLPFVATDGIPKPRGVLAFHDGTKRVGWLTGSGDGNGDAVAAERQRAEDRAEALRLLYVGLTRAKLGLWLAWGTSRCAGDSALAWLMHRETGATSAATVDEASIAARLAVLRAAAPDAIRIEDAATALPATRLAAEATPPAPPAAIAQREIARDWWIYSYSQLAREDTGAAAEEHGADDEDDPLALSAPLRSPFVGARFGNSLHHALEHVDVARWRDWIDAAPPPGEAAALLQALRSEGYAPDTDDAGVALLCALVRNTLNVRLPEGTRLVDLPDAARRNELEFHLGLAPVAVPALIAVLHRHGIATARQGFGLRRRIEGLLTGRIDLVYRHDGRYYVLDYKSNLLPDYTPHALDTAVRDSEYDLQYALYAVALHRWLRFRLGDSYEAARDFGGVRYLYCRGLDAGRDDGAGIHAPSIPLALLHDLDALFAGRGGHA
ncbi:exodeoxyribonuclease V subunit beta [Chiayiivirga flava]|uniref:RecBCD enzyme subunit RecB n=1 Tax=Chiayiivirga flava TaxID=659595 RepID=A0A7W8D762_9GAMM|nr:exodeoxyribonuclease V subunit beta [Chiayiivirga flava]MBB5207962.1 exodeoxyribonuclease V beta subunit [Chiayiivirga flava]